MKASDNFTKPKAGVDHCTSSPASRDRLTAQMVARRQIFQREIARRDRVHGIAHRPGEAQAARGHVAVDGKGGARQRGGAQRRFIQPLARILETAAVAREHFHIGQQVMAEGDRLRRLHMGEAGHDGGDMLFGLRQQARGCSSSRPLSARSQAARTQSRKSVTTWSLRERAVCSRPAAGPTISASRASMLR